MEANNKQSEKKDLEQRLKLLDSYKRFGLALGLIQEKTPESIFDAAAIIESYYTKLRVLDDEGNEMNGRDLPSIQKTISQLRTGLERHQQIEGEAMDTIQQFGGAYKMLLETTPLEGIIQHFKHNGLDINKEKYSAVFDYKDKSLQELNGLAKKDKDNKVKIALQEAMLLYRENMLNLRFKYLKSAFENQRQELEKMYKG
jgi:hypothetical protein